MNNRYKELLVKDLTHEGDIERKALFHILANNVELYDMLHEIYDFKDHSIKPECLQSAKLTSATRSLVNLGFNLYNNYNKVTVYSVFVSLDSDNTQIALDAIKIRFVG